MSYSFSIRSAGKALAKAAVKRELDFIEKTQPEHAADLGNARVVVDAFIDVLADDPTMDVLVSMHGSLSWRGEGQFTAASVGVSAYLTTREA